MKGYIYILICRNNRYYVGSSNNLKRRIEQHNRGKVKSTKNLRPVKLAFYQIYPSVKIARKVESWVKKQKSKNIIEQIIKDNKILKNFN